MGWCGKKDPMEELTAAWLTGNGIKFRRDDAGPSRLDFYLPDFDLYIEVKRFHTDRISEQMSRVPNVIAIQGIHCLQFLNLLKFRPKNEANGSAPQAAPGEGEAGQQGQGGGSPTPPQNRSHGRGLGEAQPREVRPLLSLPPQRSIRGVGHEIKCFT